MVKAIMHGCNGKMGQVISGLVKEDDVIEIVAGIDKFTGIENPYPVFTSLAAVSYTHLTLPTKLEV